MTDHTSAVLLSELAQLPEFLHPLATNLTTADLSEINRFAPPADANVRQSAVLILFGQGEHGPDVLLLERAQDMRSHAGQPAFPGGGAEDHDADLIDTALREAAEETLLDRSGVLAFATLPAIWVPPSGFVVTAVVAWWRDPSAFGVGDPAEVASVHRVPVADLVDPQRRVRVTHPSGYEGPGFDVSGMLVWGFTGMLLDRILMMGQWEKPWREQARIVPFDSVSRQRHSSPANSHDRPSSDQSPSEFAAQELEQELDL